HDTTLTTAADWGVLANDQDANGTAPQAVLVTGPAHGTLTVNDDGSFTYQPAAGYVGMDSFTYDVQDSSDTSNAAAVQIAVTDQAPDAPDASYTVHAGATLNVQTPGLGFVATDPDDDTITFQLLNGPQHGTLQFRPNGTFVYNAAPGFVGTDTF